MISTMNVFNSYFENLTTDSDGSAIFLSRSVIVNILNIHVFSCSSSKDSTVFIENAAQFNIRCCYFMNNKAYKRVALSCSTRDYQTGSVNDSSMIKHYEFIETNDIVGTTMAIFYSIFHSSSCNISSSELNHISGTGINTCKESVLNFFQFTKCISLSRAVLLQTENCLDSTTIKNSNFIDNDNGDYQYYGLIRAYKCDMKLHHCFIQNNSAHLIFSSEHSTIYLEYCDIDALSYTGNIDNAFQTVIGMNVILNKKCNLNSAIAQHMNRGIFNIPKQFLFLFVIPIC